MSEHQHWQLDSSAPELYERFLVPAITSVWAADLIDANRLYRAAASRAGDAMIADVLDDLERRLLEIVHGPSNPTLAQLNQLRLRLDAATLLFKVRVLHDELRERETAPAIPRTRT